MSRTGVEAKLPWQQVPGEVRQQIAGVLGAPVVRAMRVWGGYGPTPTFRLALADGRRAFLKGTYQASNEFSKRALLFEERAYRELRPLLSAWMPEVYAALRYDDWHMLILEDLGPKSVPPWTPERTRAITHAFADFHQSTLDAQLPAWLNRPDDELASESWAKTREESQDFYHLAAFAVNESALAQEWLRIISPTIDCFMGQHALKEGPYAILHGDVRSDNLRFLRKRLYLFDWPAISVGRPEWDVVAFAQSVTVEGGPLPEQVIAWYGERFPVRSEVVECALAFWLTFFADRAWRPDIPGLPRLRRFQRQQFGVLALWAARQWSLPQPTWARQFIDG